MTEHAGAPHCWHYATEQTLAIVCCHCADQQWIRSAQAVYIDAKVTSSDLHALVTGREHGPFKPKGNEDDR